MKIDWDAELKKFVELGPTARIHPTQEDYAEYFELLPQKPADPIAQPPVDPRIQALYDHTQLVSELIMKYWWTAPPPALFGRSKPCSRWKRLTYPFRVAKCRLLAAWDALRGLDYE